MSLDDHGDFHRVGGIAKQDQVIAVGITADVLTQIKAGRTHLERMAGQLPTLADQFLDKGNSRRCVAALFGNIVSNRGEVLIRLMGKNKLHEGADSDRWSSICIMTSSAL